MNWDEIEKKHQQQLKNFEVLRTESWLQLQKDFDARRESFGCKEDEIPESMKEKEGQDIANWREQWNVNGIKENEMKAAQQQERDKLTQTLRESIKQKVQEWKSNYKERDSDRER